MNMLIAQLWLCKFDKREPKITASLDKVYLMYRKCYSIYVCDELYLRVYLFTEISCKHSNFFKNALRNCSHDFEGIYIFSKSKFKQ